MRRWRKSFRARPSRHLHQRRSTGTPTVERSAVAANAAGTAAAATGGAETGVGAGINVAAIETGDAVGHGLDAEGAALCRMSFGQIGVRSRKSGWRNLPRPRRHHHHRHLTNPSERSLAGVRKILWLQQESLTGSGTSSLSPSCRQSL